MVALRFDIMCMIFLPVVDSFSFQLSHKASLMQESRRISFAVNNPEHFPPKIRMRTSTTVLMSTVLADQDATKNLKDYAILAIVPIVWGSYSPLVKGLYSAAEVIAPPPLIFNLLSYFVSSVALAVAGYIANASKGTKGDTEVSSTSLNVESTDIVKKGFRLEWTAGIELGFWLFLGSTVQISGIQLTTAIRAAIIVQLTTILVPLFETFLVNKTAISSKLWTSCIIAMLGVVIVSTDGGSFDTLCSSFSPICLDRSLAVLKDSIKFSAGDLLVGLSAIFYSMHVIRLGTFASRVNPIKLAQMKSYTELVLSVAAISVVCYFGGNDMNSLSKFSQYLQVVRTSFVESGQIYVALAILWNGAFATALTTWAQTVGQRSVSPTTANLLYSSQPIWAALFSFSFLSESISMSTFVGSSLLFAAVTYSLYSPPTSPATPQ